MVRGITVVAVIDLTLLDYKQSSGHGQPLRRVLQPLVPGCRMGGILLAATTQARRRGGRRFTDTRKAEWATLRSLKVEEVPISV